MDIVPDATVITYHARGSITDGPDFTPPHRPEGRACVPLRYDCRFTWREATREWEALRIGIFATFRKVDGALANVEHETSFPLTYGNPPAWVLDIVESIRPKGPVGGGPQ
ncbi:hypothetical protein [Streptomyces sp. NPDC088752]|uniref:hypothetical protein n=1 Tax=Streptomyces sp. NPDC088752 TaxID=3154963 RepID=UPI0034344254